MVKRQFPNPKDLASLMRFKTPTLNAKKRRLDSALTIADLRDHREAPHADRRVRLHRRRRRAGDLAGARPPGLRRHRVQPVDPARDGGGRHLVARSSAARSALPFAIAPTGFTRLMQTEGEIAGAGAAGAAGIPFTLSTLGTTLDRGGQGRQPRRAQLVPALRDARPRDLLRADPARGRGRASTRCIFTVDTPVAGARLRDKRNGFSIPPQLTPGDHPRRAPPPLVVVGLPDHPEARVRLALVNRRHRRRAARRGDGSDDLVQRPRRDPRHVARASS